MSKIYLIGLNHKTATVEIREKFALTEFTSAEKWPFSRNHLGTRKKKPHNCRLQVDSVKCVGCGKFVTSDQGGRCTAKTRWFRKQHATVLQSAQENALQQEVLASKKLPVLESLILSTCNRVEILCFYDGNPDDILKAWAEARGEDVESLRPYAYCYEGEEAVLHLYKVAASLDSLVLGEPQILGQLKSAYRLSMQAGQAGIMVNKILHKAFYAAKRVRTETAVASNAVSISYAAVELAKRIFDDMSQHEALLLGAGEMAELAAMHLMTNSIQKLRIVNRTFARAEELVTRIGGEAFPFEALRDCLVEADIVISSTGAQQAIINAEFMLDIMKERKNRPMFFIDIAMPRDIDPDVNTIDNIYVYDIDDLKEVVEENLAQRRGEALKAEAIVQEESIAFEAWRKSLALKPTILDIEDKGQEIIDVEMERTLKRLAKLGIEGQEIEDALEKMATAIVRKCHDAPLRHLSNSYKHNPSQASIVTIRQILNLD